jgi:hypothetical protein
LQVLVADSREFFDNPLLEDVERFPSQDDKLHQIGRVISLMELHESLTNIQTFCGGHFF